MIATGTHSFAFPIILTSIMTNGFDQLLMPSMLAENLAMAGAAMAIALTRKDKADRGVAISASLSAILGISEPAMYGDLGISNVIVGCVTIVISLVAAFLATWFLAKSGIKVKGFGEK